MISFTLFFFLIGTISSLTLTGSSIARGTKVKKGVCLLKNEKINLDYSYIRAVKTALLSVLIKIAMLPIKNFSLIENIVKFRKSMTLKSVLLGEKAITDLIC